MGKERKLISLIEKWQEVISKILVGSYGYKSCVQEYNEYVLLVGRPPTLGDFIACDLEGNVLEKPDRFDDKWFRSNVETRMQISFQEREMVEKIDNYQEALDRVIFEGCQHYKTKGGHVIHNKYGHLLGFYNGGKLNSRHKTIEDLVPLGLTFRENKNK